MSSDTSAATRVVEEPADRLGGVAFLLDELHNCAPFLLSSAFKMADPFFSISISLAMRPTSRSSSAMRSACGSVTLPAVPFSKSLEALATKSDFYLDSSSGLMEYSRAAWATLLAPVSISSTTWALNSALKLRRPCI